MTQADLNEARDLRDKIRAEERRLNSLRVAAQNLVPILDGMPHAQTQSSRVEKIAALILDTEHELEELKAKFETACVTIARNLRDESLTAQEQEILTLRYVGCMNFRDIEFKTNLSDARIFYLHRHALKKIKVIVQ